MGEFEKKMADVRAVRTHNDFDIPNGVPGDVKSISIIELTAQEELQAAKRAGGDPFLIAYELAKQSLAEVNGEHVSLTDGSADVAWAKMHPKVRELVVKAHQEIHSASKEQEAAFLKSRKVRVG